jgi:hypothetical protein
MIKIRTIKYCYVMLIAMTIFIEASLGQSDSPLNYVSRVEAHALSDAVYGDNFGADTLSAGWKLHRGIVDERSGLKSAVYIRESDGQRVLSFAGTETAADWRTNIISSSSIFDWLPHWQYDSAEQIALTNIHENHFSGLGKPLILVGDSKGGGHVEYAGAKTKTMGIAIHPAPLGNVLYARIPDTHKEWANFGGIVRLELKSDPVSKLDFLPGSQHLGVEEVYDTASSYYEGYRKVSFHHRPEFDPYYMVLNHVNRDLLRLALIERESGQLHAPKSPVPVSNQNVDYWATNEKLSVGREYAENLAISVKTLSKELKRWERLNPREGKLTDQLDFFQDAYDLCVAIEKDMAHWNSTGNFVFLRSHTVEALGRLGIDKSVEGFVDYLAKRNGLPKGQKYATFGSKEFLHAAARHIRDGRADIDTIELYLDGFVGLTAGALGYRLGGHKMAATFQEVAMTSAKLARKATAKDFKKIFVWWRGDGHKFIDTWRKVQEFNVANNIAVQSYEEYFGRNSIESQALSSALRNQLSTEADLLERQRLVKHQSSSDKKLLQNLDELENKSALPEQKWKKPDDLAPFEDQPGHKKEGGVVFFKQLKEDNFDEDDSLQELRSKLLKNKSKIRKD